VTEKGTKILPEADIIIASKISAGPYPTTWLPTWRAIYNGFEEPV
jgi:hypothetical protein